VIIVDIFISLHYVFVSFQMFRTKTLTNILKSWVSSK